MKHFLGTRFNLTVPDWKTSKNGEAVLTEKWLENRFNLFKNYCLPSVKNQTNQNFVWCIFFDVNTPLIYKKKIEIISQEYKNLHPIFIDGISNLVPSFKDFIIKNSNYDEYIITTRLDNDDLIHKDFIKTIQKLYSPIAETVIDLQSGYQVTLPINFKNHQIRSYNHPSNAFISVIEHIDNFNTIYSKMHYDWKNSNNIISYDKKKMWIELVHQENKVNYTLIGLKRKYSISNNDFGVKKNLCIKEDISEVAKINFTSFFRKRIQFLKKWLKDNIISKVI